MNARLQGWSACLAALLASCGGPAVPSDEGRPPDAERPALVTLSASRGGQDVLGQAFPEPSFDAWLAAEGEASAGAAPPAPATATLYRWWTDTCPFCEASLPAFETLRRRHAERGLAVVAVYHPKPPRPVDADSVRRLARERGYAGVVALDLDWSELERFYLSTGARAATSASFLVDGEGVIRFVHPGPVLHPATGPGEEQQDVDFRLLERAVEALLD